MTSHFSQRRRLYMVLRPDPQSAKWRHHTRRETSETTPHSSHLRPIQPSHFNFSTRWRPRPVQRHPPSYPVPPFCPPRAFHFNPSSASSSSVPLLILSSQEGAPTPVLCEPPSPYFSLLIRAVIEPHPGPVQDP